MKYEFDPVKNASNIIKHGLSLEDAQWLEWETAYILEDTRKAYPERRYQALGLIEERLHMLVFCMPDSQTIRVISLRKANRREVKIYAENS
ncbi:BrnT family toxin [Oxalobacter paraformigenes]|uniref:BrnT family toxin n=1 Tax=Oxalobacter paraformigenes TaxID=556268 RepID=C3X1Y7_9BURK|nr:BrnT family toxin [Oxalobacter paraformigenes]EEO27223.1 hypothetical protein OFAG_00376 [Oxalobacter paraformigenes]